MMTYANAYPLDAQTETVIFDVLCGTDAKNFAIWRETSRPYYVAGDDEPSVEAQPNYASSRSANGGSAGQKTCFYETDCSEAQKHTNGLAWEWLISKYGEGSIKACETFHLKLKNMVEGLSNNGELSSDPDKFRDNVVKSLHDGGCSIDAYDDNIESFVEALNLLFQQKARMKSAQTSADAYKDKLENLKDAWIEDRTLFETEMSEHAKKIEKHLDDSALYAIAGELAEATSELKGVVSAREETHLMEGTIRQKMKEFENSAYQLKRDAIRWSQLNQISNEHERAQYFIENVKAKAYAILNTCMINYQLEWAI